jgi:hypothetical protein
VHTIEHVQTVLNFGAAGAADAASLEAAELTYNSGAPSSAAAAGPAEPMRCG